MLIAYVLRESRNKLQQAEDDANADLLARAPDMRVDLKRIYDAVRYYREEYGNKAHMSLVNEILYVASAEL